MTSWEACAASCKASNASSVLEAPGGTAGECVHPRAPAAVFFLFQFSLEDGGFHGDHSCGRCCDTMSLHGVSIPCRDSPPTSHGMPYQHALPLYKRAKEK